MTKSSSMNMIRILIAETPGMTRDGVKEILERDEGICVCGLVSDARKVYDICAEVMPDLILMDIEMMSVKTNQRIKKDFPEIKILALADADDFQTVAVALSGGADGYIPRTVDGEGLISTVRSVRAGLGIYGGLQINEMIRSVFYLNGGVSDNSLEFLKERDEEILFWIAQGKTNEEIQERTFLSKGRVKNRVTELMVKFGVENRTQLAVFFVRNYPHVMYAREMEDKKREK